LALVEHPLVVPEVLEAHHKLHQARNLLQQFLRLAVVAVFKPLPLQQLVGLAQTEI
jgi:hypothetical protein